MMNQEDQWACYQSYDGNNPLFVSYNVSFYHRLDTIADNLLGFFVDIKEPTENGLPTRKEFDSLSAIEDSCSMYMNKNNAVFAGRTTGSNWQILFWYTDKLPPDIKDFMTQIKEISGYNIRYFMQIDHDKSVYKEWYNQHTEPTKDNIKPGLVTNNRVAADNSVIQSLQEQGDLLVKQRQINYFFHFENVQDRAIALAIFKTKGFIFEDRFDIDSDSTHPSPVYVLSVSEQGIPTREHISQRHEFLTNLAKTLHGEYTGWETQAVLG